MGNQKFKLSGMIPNAWFYKLKYMGTKTTNHLSSPPPPLPTKINHSNSSTTKSKLVAAAAQQQQPPYQLSQPRKSYHFTRELSDPKSKILDSYNYNHVPTDPPRKSAKRRSTKRKSTATTVTTTRYSTSLSSCSSPSSHKLINSSVSSSGCSSRAPVDSFRPKHGSPPPPPSPINDSESDHFSTMPQFSPPDHALLSGSEVTCSRPEGGGRSCYSTTCTCKLESKTAAADDVVIDVDEKSLAQKDGKSTVVVTDELDSISRLVELPPILTKKMTKLDHLKTRDSIDESSVKYKRTSNLIAARKSINNGSLSSLKFIHGEENNTNFKGNNNQKIRTPTRKFVASSPGVSVGLKLRLSSPRIGRKLSAGGAATGIGGRKSISGGSRKSISESFAIVKSSFDPYKDFKESMVEMIVQNNIKDSKELEELLAAYLSLNSDEYHGVIINVFKQIWFDLNNIKGRQRKVV